MAVHLVTGFRGEEHIQSADQGSFNASFFGEGEFVMEAGNQCDASIIDNNTIRILDGDILMQGRHIRIPSNTYIDLTINTGTADKNRNDLIVVEYSKDAGSGVETASLKVIKGEATTGTAADPTYATGDILSGEILNQMPLYRVKMKGVVLSDIEQLFEIIPTYKTLAEKYAEEFQTACKTHLDSLNVLDTIEEVEANTQEKQLAGALALKELSTDIAKVTSDILEETSNRQTADNAIMRDIAVERARIDAFAALEEGSTTGDAELQDIRIKSDGTTAATAGNAVREQISSLSSEIVEIKDNIIDILYDSKGNLDFSLTWENKQISSHEEQISGKRILSNIIYIPKDCTLVLLDSNYNYTIHNYDENGNHIVGGNAWFTEPYALKENTYVRIQIRKSTDENFSATNFDYKNVIEITRNIVIDYHNLSETLKAQIGVPSKTVDLFIFMGQSNMAGRGETNETWTETAPIIIDGAGYEFRAISDNTKLYPIVEPFGVNENKSNGINDGNMKTGSMVTAFANAYYSICKTPIIGVSASKGGSSISEWQPDGAYLTDAIQRLNNCVSFLESNGYTIRHKYMLWCQGETDGDYETSKENYISMFNNMVTKMLGSGIEKLFMVRIGNANISSDLNRYTDMIQWQTEISQTNENVVMVSTDFAGMRDRGLMKDDFHYYQAGYNEVGTYAGVNTAFYVNNGKEPTMYDTEYDNLYFSKKN